MTVTMRHPIAMHTTSMTHSDMHETRLPWTVENTRGAHHAERADWSAAADAFASAADIISANESAEFASHEAMALVLGNLASACFRAGRVDDGIRHAQRACALRVALVGEDAITVARARSDLAVMLCSVGRAAEASALIGRAIAGIEQYAGDEDAHLIPVLENAARVAMVMSQPASAEPYLLRMHSLLAAHDLPVHRAETLLARVAQSRTDTPRVVAAQTDVESSVVTELYDDLDAGIELELHAEADDQPLRDAVAVTDVLLRTTPTGSPLIRRDDGLDDAWSSGRTESTSHDALEDMRSGAQPPTSEPMADDTEVVETFALELERDLHATIPSSALGFTVEYGFTGYEEQSLPPLELHPGAESATCLRPPAPRSSPRGVAVVMPSPSAGVPRAGGNGATDSDECDDAAAPKNTLVVQGERTRERRPFGAALRAGRATAPKSSHGAMIAAIVTIVVGCAAAWAYLHGGF